MAQGRDRGGDTKTARRESQASEKRFDGAVVREIPFPKEIYQRSAAEVLSNPPKFPDLKRK